MLDLLLKSGPLTPKIELIHTVLRRRFNFIDRVAVTHFDPYSNQLHTFVSSNVKEDPMERYEFPMIKARSLLESMVKGPRVINDLSVLAGGEHEHTRVIREHGFQASYTVPLLYDHVFHGFIFLNSFQKNCFPDSILEEIDVYCHLIVSAVERDMRSNRILNSALSLATEFLKSRNAQLEARMPRMTYITRVIAEDLVAAGKCAFDRETVERLCRFAAFHDIGKMAIAESILLKEERLTVEEFAIITTHTEKGLEIIDSILKNFELQSTPGVEMLRNIVLSHHEKIDGSGYPHQLRGDQIPIEARIVAVADIYDALTSDRPHRFALSGEEAFARLEKLDSKLDADCLASIRRVQDKLPPR